MAAINHINAAIAAYEAGVPVKKIEKKYAVHGPNLYYHLKRRGVPLRDSLVTGEGIQRTAALRVIEVRSNHRRSSRSTLVVRKTTVVTHRCELTVTAAEVRVLIEQARLICVPSDAAVRVENDGTITYAWEEKT